MECANCALGRLRVVGVGDGAHQGRHHLGAVHDGVVAGLLLAELEDHHGGLGHDHLNLVVEQLDELGDGPGDQDGVVLVVDKVHHRVLQHLQGSGNTSFSAHKRFSYIACIIYFEHKKIKIDWCKKLDTSPLQ